MPEPHRVKLVFIGDRFYAESGGHMSSLYQKVAGGSRPFLRFDYGQLNLALKKGCNITLRQATPAELGLFESLLKTMKTQREG